MNEKILKTVRKFNMLSKSDTVVVGVSGGADSMLLLNFLIWARTRYDLKLIVANVEHGIRGQASVDDSLFVKDFCDKNDIEFHCLTINSVEGAKANKISVEEYSRLKRYEFFESFNADKIATAHNLTDNVETVIFRLLRGTGLKGVCGIPPVRDNIIRPLIEISNSDIRKYCDDNLIDYRIDCTNLQNDYSRNYIRNVILPEFSEINSEYLSNINRFANNAMLDYDFISAQASIVFEQAYVDGKLKKDVLNNCHLSLTKRVIQKYFLLFNLHLDDYQIYNILALLKKNSRFQIKGNFYALSDSKYLRFADFSDKSNNLKFVSNVLNISEFTDKDIDFYCDYDKISGNIKLRYRLPSDSISPYGRGCTKKVSQLFKELKISQEKRDYIPIVVDDNSVVGIVGICVDKKYTVDNNTKNVLTVKLSSED